jgi:hypothetical protein
MDPRIIDKESLEVSAVSDTPEIAAARELISKAEGLFVQVSDEDKEDMVGLIETITTCIDAQDINGLDEPSAQLTDIIYYLES